MSKIVVEMSGDSAKLYRAYEKIIRKQAEMETGQKKLGNTATTTGSKLEDAGRKGQKAFGTKAVASLANYAAGFVGITAALAAVRAGMRDVEEQRRKAFEGNRSFAEVQAGAINMLGDVGVKGVDKFIARVDKLAAKIKPRGGKATVYEVLETTLSAAGDRDLAFKAATLGMQLGRKSTEEATAIAGGLLDISQVTGERGDMRKNAGFMLASVGQARVTSLEAMAKYGAPAVSSIKSTGTGTAGGAMALFTSITKALADPEGRRSGTVAVGLAQKLKESLPDLPSTRSRIEHMWANPEARAKFEATYVEKMPAKSIGGIKDLLSGRGSQTAGHYLTAIEKIPDVQQAGGFTDRKIAALNRPFAGKMAKGEQVVESTIEQLYTETEYGRENAMQNLYSAESLDKLFAAASQGPFERFANVNAYRASFGQTNKEAFTSSVEQRIKEIENSSVYKYRMSESDRDKTVEILSEGLKELERETKRQTEAIIDAARKGHNPTLAPPNQDKPRNG